MMRVTPSKLKDAKILEPKVFGDDRGFFMEVYNKNTFDEILGGSFNFVQDNYSRSTKDVLRGMHFQVNFPQGKLVRVVRGEVMDVAVDLRKNSPTFGMWDSVILSEDNKKQFWLPPGFAHGFLVLSDVADFEYKCTEFYHPEDEACLKWNDKSVDIKWPINSPTLSSKDAQGKSLENLMIDSKC